jgi:uncharacterized protein YndB with AHSA1/START domain
MSQESTTVSIVFQEKIIPASVEEVWRHLTEGALLREWFADTEGLKPQGDFVFNFGDGDFFSGQVLEWDAPHFLRFKWKFMGVGQTFDIRYMLRRMVEAKSTRLTVRDEGALTPEEAEGLVEGWEDFLMRLERRIQTQEPTRYSWSQTINVTALLGKTASVAIDTFQNQAWWQKNFPETRASLAAANGNALKFDLRDEAWNGVELTVKIALRQCEGAAYAEVNHDGWTTLAPERQIAERRRYAQLWAQALRQLEREAVTSQN